MFPYLYTYGTGRIPGMRIMIIPKTWICTQKISPKFNTNPSDTHVHTQSKIHITPNTHFCLIKGNINSPTGEYQMKHNRHFCHRLLHKFLPARLKNVLQIQ